MLDITTKTYKEMSADELNAIIKLCAVSDIDEPENAMTEKMFTQVVNEYKQRKNAYAILGKVDGVLVSTISIIPSEDSKYFVLNPERKQAVEALLNTSINKVFVPALMFTHPDHRDQGYAKQVTDAMIDEAKALGFEYVGWYGVYNMVSTSYWKNNYHLEVSDIEGITQLEDPESNLFRYMPL